MIPRRHSVFFKLHFFFFLAIIVLSLLFITALQEQAHQRINLLTHRSMELARIIEQTKVHTCAMQTTKLEAAGFQSVPYLDSKCTLMDLPAPLRSKLRSNNVEVSLYEDAKGYIYALKQQHCTMFYRDTVEANTYYFIWTLFLALFGGLVTIYLLLWNSLRPLKKLYEEIRRYGEGATDIDTRSSAQDEIALISNEFHSALEKQSKLKASRELFLRNIMHELKTPITKGKLIVELEDPSPNITLLSKLFFRMERLIAQMAYVEKMQALPISQKDVRLIELIDNACSNLLLPPESYTLAGCDITLHVDPELFTSALQNLIDNAYTHATQVPIMILCTKEGICIHNHGAPLTRPIEEAFEAFVSERESAGGLGLGLYIAKLVAQLHHYELDYRYNEGIHCFCIRFKKQA